MTSLHGGPGAQVPNQPFTGQNNPNADFYNDYNYGRAIEWLRWMTDIIHTREQFRNAGMLELINEPLNWGDQVDSLRSQFYVEAYNVSVPILKVSWSLCSFATRLSVRSRATSTSPTTIVSTSK